MEKFYPVSAELGGAMTEKLAELFDEKAAPPKPARTLRKPRAA